MPWNQLTMDNMQLANYTQTSISLPAIWHPAIHEPLLIVYCLLSIGL
jgi:hypothetical protein